jgi:hypothetical protein
MEGKRRVVCNRKKVDKLFVTEESRRVEEWILMEILKEGWREKGLKEERGLKEEIRGTKSFHSIT